ncbi:MAG: fasciclin domain-containing protein [Bacteroidales bacterium]|nr:fasciclin domain-containing protein [Bacteroidales bacterium]
MRRLINIVFLACIMLTTCMEYDYLEETAFDLLIGEYFENNPGEFSLFCEMLSKSNTLSFLKAYGTYTVFAPTNDAVETFLTSKNKTSLDDFTAEELKDYVRYHVIIDTISTTEFTDGRLSTATMYGQYLTVSGYNEEGSSVYKINKYAAIENADIHAANGIIHAISTVLEPVTTPIAGFIEQNPDLSIFGEALKTTGLYDTLMLTPDKDLPSEERRWFTMLLPSNDVLALDSIYSVDDLIGRYSNTGNPKDPADSLYLYISYHIIDNNLSYVGDLVTQPVLETLAPNEIITIKLKGDSVLINEDLFLGVLEKGSPVNRNLSDNTAANGVYHILDKDIFIKVRNPVLTFWDVCDQPELRKMAGIFRKPGQWVDLEPGQLAGITWSGSAPVTYECHSDWWQDHLIYRDCFKMFLRTAVIPSITFTTPTIVKGKYKMWICTRNSPSGAETNRRPKFVVYFNGEPLPTIINTGYTISSSMTDEELELIGYKRYSYNPTDSITLTDNAGRFVAQLAGSVDVPSTGQHTITFEVINNGDKEFWVDMIQFIPFEEDQLWPRIDNDGILRDKPDWYPLP